MSAAACPLCGGERLRTVAEQPDARYFPRTIVACQRCGYAFVHPRPDRATLARVYAEPEYFDRGVPPSREAVLANPRVRGRALARLRWLARHLRPGTLLDVGCHRGEFLVHASAAGWRPSGQDLSAWAAAEARAVSGCEVHAEPLPELAARGLRFDLVTAWDVIEHVPDPVAFLTECRALIAPGGALALSTPNQRNYHGVLHGDRWKGYRDGPEHLHFFRRSTLARALELAGFEVLAARTRRIAPVHLRWLAPLGLGNELEMLARPASAIVPAARDPSVGTRA